MNKRLLKSLIPFLFLVSVIPAYGQIDPALLQQAQSMGLSQSQINNALSGQQGKQGSQSSSLSSSRGNTGLGDTITRRPLSAADLEKVNPVLLEKIISEMIDEEGSLYDVRQGGRILGTQTQRGQTGTQLPVDSQQLRELEYYRQQEKDYEIVIRDGRYIKRPLPVVFGREIFTNRNLTFEPNYNMATPPTYVLGSGDELVIEVWGTSELFERVKVSTEGTVSLAGVGPIPVAGLTVQEASRRVASQVNQVMTGANVSVSLGQIRSIKVNIGGEALVPGSYTLPSLATVFNALYAAGGVNKIGSLRSIKVYRNSRLVADLDVYDYLIRGEYETNIRLEDNDMIIVSPYENFVTIYGQVKRDRTYEMKRGETLATLVDYAGGFKGDAYSENLQVRRKTGRQYQLLTVDKNDFAEFPLNDGDSVQVGRIIEEYANRLTIEGAVWRPGEYEFSASLNTLAALIEKAEGLKGNEFATRGQITRRKPDYTYEVIPFDPVAVASGRVSIELRPEDEIFIPTIMEMREEFTVTIAGEVNHPDTLPYRDNMTIEDLILQSGGLKESASLARIEVARRIKDPNSTTYTDKIAEIHTFNITEDLAITSEARRFTLNPFDNVYIRRSPGYSEQKSVTVTGEVLFEGPYVLATSGERISDLIRKAGGFTPEAYVKGASVKRKLTEDEIAQIESLRQIATSSNSSRDSLSLATVDLPTVYPIGVDVERAVANPGSPDDIILRDGDIVFVPKLTNTVKITGAVLYPNTVVYDGGKLRKYISQAGGYRDMARRKPYVLYMNGKVMATRGGLFGRRFPKIEPGCQVVVPMKLPRDKTGLSATMGILSSTTSMAAMIATMISTLNQK